MTEESEIFRITNSHTYHSALKYIKKSTNWEKSHCLPQRLKIKIKVFSIILNIVAPAKGPGTAK